VKQPPASIRHRNPGAMYPGPSSRRYGATTEASLEGGKHRIATFPTHEDGAAALFDLLGRAYMDRTLEAAIRRWCGANHAGVYLDGIEKRTDLGRDTWLDRDFICDPERAIPLAIAMARHEAGRDYPLKAAAWEAAHARAVAALPAPKGKPKPRPASPAASRPEPWTPDNPVPSPRPEARVPEVTASRKWRISEWWSRLMLALGIGTGGTTIADQAGVARDFVSTVKDFAMDNAVLLVLGGVVAGLVVSETIKALTREDVEDGRYVPSGSEVQR
jgi:hypothetical protein